MLCQLLKEFRGLPRPIVAAAPFHSGNLSALIVYAFPSLDEIRVVLLQHFRDQALIYLVGRS